MPGQPPQSRPSRQSPATTFGLVAIVIGAILYVLVYANTNWHPYAVWLAAWGGTTFVLYGFDKLQAPRQGLRVPEVVLHGLALLGGFLGGWAGMFLFWHKVRHISFWLVLVLSTLLHAGLAYYWFWR